MPRPHLPSRRSRQRAPTTKPAPGPPVRRGRLELDLDKSQHAATERKGEQNVATGNKESCRAYADGARRSERAIVNVKGLVNASLSVAQQRAATRQRARNSRTQHNTTRTTRTRRMTSSERAGNKRPKDRGECALQARRARKRNAKKEKKKQTEGRGKGGKRGGMAH